MKRVQGEYIYLEELKKSDVGLKAKLAEVQMNIKREEMKEEILEQVGED